MLIEAKNLSYGRITGGRMLGENLTFELNSGTLLSVTGPNGSGKSTFFRVIQGLSPIFSGKLKIHVPPSQIAILPQMPNPGFHLPITLGDLLSFSIRGRLDWNKAFSYGLIEPSHLQLAWNTASGGERKRTLLTRLLLQEPSLLLLDEPMNHLDSDSRSRVEKVIAQFLREAPPKNRAVVLISHSNFKTEELLQAPTIHLPLKNELDVEEEDTLG